MQDMEAWIIVKRLEPRFFLNAEENILKLRATQKWSHLIQQLMGPPSLNAFKWRPGQNALIYLPGVGLDGLKWPHIILAFYHSRFFFLWLALQLMVYPNMTTSLDLRFQNVFYVCLQKEGGKKDIAKGDHMENTL